MVTAKYILPEQNGADGSTILIYMHSPWSLFGYFVAGIFFFFIFLHFFLEILQHREQVKYFTIHAIACHNFSDC